MKTAAVVSSTGGRVLPATARLRRRVDFDHAVRGGRRAGTRLLSVHVRTTAADAGPARAGFVVGRAVGPAVVRNRVRRRLRHAVRELLPQLPAGAMVVIRAHPGAASAQYCELVADLGTALRRAGRAA